MQLNSNPSFRISSALKNLIGKELITNEFVAIFELVKNSFDASAKKSTVIFENIYSKDAKIFIQDDGKGMDDKDLEAKWLFVAYSAKKEGTEDYRDKIINKRIYAGAKGVGRFSCDRLGENLRLVTTKNNSNGYEILDVDWKKFEKDSKEEFITIKAQYKHVKTTDFNFKKGTVLEISKLRDKWDRKKILKLKHSLEKLINPNQENDTKNFELELVCTQELANDKKEKEERNKINSVVKNFLFEKLNYKTTQIECSISDNGKDITTILKDRGKRIYSIREHNNYFIETRDKKEYLQDVRIHLFQLNRSAKNNFSRDMGVDPVKYGSVFLYKNGFRIYPFGEEGDDSLKIDRRKQQGYNRNLGTRDLLGRIEIYGANDNLKESTSRDGGLIKNEHYDLLLEFVEEKALKRLEEYVVNIIEWGDDRVFELDEKINVPGLNPQDVKKEISDYIKKLANAKNVIKIDYDKNFLSTINESSGQSINKALRTFAKKAKNKKDGDAYDKAVELKNEFKKITDDTKKAETKAKVAEKKLEYKIGQNAFLEDSVKADTKEFQSLLHHTEKSTYWINKHIDNLIKKIDQGAPKEKLFETLGFISLENQKIFSFTKYHKSTKFNTFVDKINQDIVSFFNEYIQNVCKFYKDYERLNIVIKTPPHLTFKKEFTPVEIPIIIDNLLNNSLKAGANKVSFEWEDISPKEITLCVTDNGKGIDKGIINEIFGFRYTTTKGGSGLGLYHIKNIMDKINGNIEVNSKVSKGTEFVITFKK